MSSIWISPEALQDFQTWDENIKKWDVRWLKIAQEISYSSKDTSTKCGAVIVDSKNRLISTGYNGFAKNVIDKEEDYNNRTLKLLKIVHAEINAIVFAKQDLDGDTLYTFPFLPCSNCAAIVINSGIKRVVAPRLFGDRKERWEDNVNISRQQFSEAFVQVVEYDISEITGMVPCKNAKENTSRDSVTDNQ